jgi:hypothetical protein
MDFVANRYADPVSAGLTNAANVPTIDLGAAGVASSAVITSNSFTFYVAWASTEASCKAICYDAVDGKALITVKGTETASNYHGWDVYWKRRF